MKVIVFGFLSIFILAGCAGDPRDSIFYDFLREQNLQDCSQRPPAERSDCERRVNSSNSSMSDKDQNRTRSTAIPQKTVNEFLKKKFPKKS